MIRGIFQEFFTSKIDSWFFDPKTGFEHSVYSEYENKLFFEASKDDLTEA